MYVALNKSKYSGFLQVSSVKFLKSDDVKSNDESVMKSHDKVRSLHGSETEGACFLGDYFKIKYPKKSNEESIHYELF